MDVQPQQFYHGGPSGRRVGDLILPPVITKARPEGHRNAYRVFVSTAYSTAVCYAIRQAVWLNGEVGKVYRVKPAGPLTVDPDANIYAPPSGSGTDYYCGSALVLEVLSPSVEDVWNAALITQIACTGDPVWPKGQWGNQHVLSLVMKYATQVHGSFQDALASMYREHLSLQMKKRLAQMKTT